MLLSLQALQVQEDELDSLHRRAKKCQMILTDEEVDADLQNLDEEAYLDLEASLDEATSLCQELVVCKTAACLSAEIQDSLQTVEQLMTDHPTKSYAAEYKDMGKLLDEMAESVRSSTLALDHPLREEVKQHKASLAALRATAPDTKPPIIIKGDERDQDLPKTSIKKFNGGLAHLACFLGTFQWSSAHQ